MTEEWSQKYQPQTEKDILISKTTYGLIKNFFTANFGNNSFESRKPFTPSILFLLGPSGSGKKSTIEFLCEQFGVAPAPPDALQITDNNEEFGNRESEYVKDLIKIFTVASTWYNPKKKVVLVVSDLPDIAYFNRKKKFDDLVSLYASRSQRMPVIFCLNSNFYNEAKIKRLFPEDIFRSNATVIKLKEYSDASMKKAIKEVASKEPMLRRCDIDTLKEDLALRCHGDLKQALNQLYLISLKYRNPNVKEIKIKKLKSTTSTQTQGSQNSMMNENSVSFDALEISSYKDREFNLFHTIGKFLYNKRIDPKTKQARMMNSKELMVLQPKFYFEPAHLINQLSVDLSLFVLFLHENYLDFYGEIEDIVEMSEVFAESDILHTFNFRKERNEVQNYQNEFENTLITSTGIMIHNLTGGDRFAQEKSDKSIKGFKPINKPKYLSIKNDIKTNVQKMRMETKDYMIPFSHIVTEFWDVLKPEDPTSQKRQFFNFGSRSNHLDEEDRCFEREAGEDTMNGNSEVSLSQFEFQEKSSLLQKRPAPYEFIEDDIEEVEY